MTDAAGPLYLDAALQPRRSLSKRGVILLMAPFVFVNLVFGTVVWTLGGALVPPFLFLDVIGVGLGLWVSFRSARRIERVRVSADEIVVTREADGRPSPGPVWRSAPAFTRVEIDHPGRHASRVRLRCKGRGLELGAGLAPGERARFAETLQAALAAARSERWPGQQ
jgi:uncharacterized membrane protein